MAKNMADSPFARKLLKQLREGGTLKRVANLWELHGRDGKLVSTVSHELILALKAAGKLVPVVEPGTVSITAYALSGGKVEEDEVTQVFVPGKGLQDVPEPDPVPLVVASAVMAKRPELLKLQQYPLDLKEQKGVVQLVGDLIRELVIKDRRIERLEGQVTKAQDAYSKAQDAYSVLSEARIELASKMSDLGAILRDKPLPEEAENDSDE